MNHGTRPIEPHDGCKPITHDVSQDWSHYQWHGKWRLKNRLFGSPLTFPDFRIPIAAINDQKYSDFCAAETVSEAIGNKVGIAMSPEYQTALIGYLTGAPIFNGADPKIALKSGTVGCLPKDKSPYTFEHDGFQKPAYFENYDPSLATEAAKYKRVGYYNVLFGGPDDADAYDMTRMAANDARLDAEADNEIPPPIMGFGFWYQEFNVAALNPACKGIMPMPGQPISRHAYLAVNGLETIGGEQKIVAQLSQGPNFGDEGVLYFGRAQWNAIWADPINNQIGMYIYRSKIPPLWNMVLAFINNAWRYVQAKT
jgi:hypothetical protein